MNKAQKELSDFLEEYRNVLPPSAIEQIERLIEIEPHWSWVDYWTDGYPDYVYTCKILAKTKNVSYSLLDIKFQKLV